MEAKMPTNKPREAADILSRVAYEVNEIPIELLSMFEEIVARMGPGAFLAAIDEHISEIHDRGADPKASFVRKFIENNLALLDPAKMN
jgi:hypothetical protein